jgi:hypothetical protein
MDMARKFIQMGLYLQQLEALMDSTRARRYANHPNGRKYKAVTENTGDGSKKKVVIPRVDASDEKSMIKAESAEIFRRVLELVKGDTEYRRLTERHKEQYEAQAVPQNVSEFEEEADVI